MFFNIEICMIKQFIRKPRGIVLDRQILFFFPGGDMFYLSTPERERSAPSLGGDSIC